MVVGEEVGVLFPLHPPLEAVVAVVAVVLVVGAC